MGTRRRSKPSSRPKLQQMLKFAEAADPGNVPEGVDLPAEIERREGRLATIASVKAKAKVVARADDQINLTDEDSRIMKVPGDGFGQCYNAQAVVDIETMLVMASHITQADNEWSLVCLAWNLKRMAVLRPQREKRTSALRSRAESRVLEPKSRPFFTS